MFIIQILYQYVYMGQVCAYIHLQLYIETHT